MRGQRRWRAVALTMVAQSAVVRLKGNTRTMAPAMLNHASCSAPPPQTSAVQPHGEIMHHTLHLLDRMA